METTETILEVMKKSGKPLSNGDIEKLTGLDKKEIEKAMKKLKDAGKITSPKRCYWEPI
ncbi:MAG TPA: MarR family transcriptional regulator [Candidatus Kapabacteria bacterium]|jgi:biotin operon repressor|nr:MarR family transcriptional regulator [Candidatus Kapabacteria bacterium]HOV92386.1 MarR family transcriptional regulator [Candidatus Kapabacteria bacterium]